MPLYQWQTGRTMCEHTLPTDTTDNRPLELEQWCDIGVGHVTRGYMGHLPISLELSQHYRAHPN